mgnify:CR=1 FL=1
MDGTLNRMVFTDEQAQEIAHAVWNHLAIETAAGFVAWEEKLERHLIAAEGALAMARKREHPPLRGREGIKWIPSRETQARIKRDVESSIRKLKSLERWKDSGVDDQEFAEAVYAEAMGMRLSVSRAVG